MNQIRNITEEYKFVNKTNQKTIDEVSRNVRQLIPVMSTYEEYKEQSDEFWSKNNPFGPLILDTILKPALFTALSQPIAKALQLVYEPGSILWDFYFPKGYYNVEKPAWIGRDDDVLT